MTQTELSVLVKRLWSTTQVPLTHEQLAQRTGLAKRDVEHGMRGLLRAGEVDLDVNDQGDVVWVVPHLPRAAEVTEVSLGGSGVSLRLSVDPEKKSVLLSAGMGLLFGPFGWLYASPWAEAALGIAAYVLAMIIVPRFLLGTLFGLVHPTCGVLAMLYAWRFNQTKLRTPILFASSPTRSRS